MLTDNEGDDPPYTEIHDGSGPPYYMSLGINTTTTQDNIRRAYYEQARIWHPDKNAHRLAEATEMFKMLGEAFETLSDPAKRADYDYEMGVEPVQSETDQPMDAPVCSFSTGNGDQCGGHASGTHEPTVIHDTELDGDVSQIAKAARLNGAMESSHHVNVDHLFDDVSDDGMGGGTAGAGDTLWPIVERESDELEWITPDQWRRPAARPCEDSLYI